MRKVLLLAIGQLFLLTGILAQEKTLSGKVTDEGGGPVPNVSVVVKGTKTGTTTNADGSFLLKVPATATTLVFSSVNYETQKITIGNATAFEVKLKASTNPMNEVVVVGFTTSRKKRDEAGAISTVKASQLENFPNASVDKALQ